MKITSGLTEKSAKIIYHAYCDLDYKNVDLAYCPSSHSLSVNMIIIPKIDPTYFPHTNLDSSIHLYATWKEHDIQWNLVLP